VVKEDWHRLHQVSASQEGGKCLVRKFVGYLRLDTHEERDALNQAYEALILFIPRRKGSGVKRFYDKPQTPLRRTIPFVGQEKSHNLLGIKENLKL
jgi:hypothetical protein